MRKQKIKLIAVSTILLLSLLIASTGANAASKPVLRKGMSSTAVKTLQTDLKKLGFFHVEPTGYFGDITLSSVKSFQRKYKIPTTGVVAKLTHAKLDELLRPAPPEKPKPDGLQNGNTGPEVMKLQGDLIVLGYMKVEPTGYFGSITEAALSQFQKFHGLEPHGVGDESTLALISRLIEQYELASRGGDDREIADRPTYVSFSEVNVEWVSGLPQIPYIQGVGKYDGVVFHYTDNPGDSARIEANYSKYYWQNAFVHEFIDADEIIQVADPDYKAWGAGKYANDRFIHLELCDEKTQSDFDISFKRMTRRTAEYLYINKLGVSPAKADGTGTLWAHIDVTRYLGGTNHTDPIAYLAKWDKTWDDVVDAVTSEYNALVAENGANTDSNVDESNISDDTAETVEEVIDAVAPAEETVDDITVDNTVNGVSSDRTD